jgi:hypothetical protein
MEESTEFINVKRPALFSTITSKLWTSHCSYKYLPVDSLSREVNLSACQFPNNPKGGENSCLHRSYIHTSTSSGQMHISIMMSAERLWTPHFQYQTWLLVLSQLRVHKVMRHKSFFLPKNMVTLELIKSMWNIHNVLCSSFTSQYKTR